MAILTMAPPTFSQNVDIPDNIFLASLINQGVDRDGDHMISYEEAEQVRSLDLTRKGDEVVLSQEWTMKSGSIINLKGIEAFTHLVSLDCSFNVMRNPDFSNNRMLENLNVSFCGLSELNLAHCSNLKVINCSFNKLTGLVLPDNGGTLEELDCFQNHIKELELSKCPSLKFLDCGRNPIKHLDISANQMLRCLHISYLSELETITGWSESFPPPAMDLDASCTTGWCYVVEFVGQQKILSEFMKLYPNPVTDQFTIEWPGWSDCVIEMTSANGQFIHCEKVSGNSLQFDLSPYPQGIYCITVRTADGVATGKVLKR